MMLLNRLKSNSTAEDDWRQSARQVLENVSQKNEHAILI